MCFHGSPPSRERERERVCMLKSKRTALTFPLPAYKYGCTHSNSSKSISKLKQYKELVIAESVAMALKSLLFVSVLVAVMAAPLAEAQLGLVNGLLGLIRIQGTVFCTANGNVGVNGAATPIFPNATVQLQCGAGNVVSTVTTNGSGIFSIILDPVQFLLSSLLSNCNLVVRTPLASCNAGLPPVGGLLSPLQFIGSTLLGLLNVSNIIPAGFQFLPNLRP